VGRHTRAPTTSTSLEFTSARVAAATAGHYRRASGSNVGVPATCAPAAGGGSLYESVLRGAGGELAQDAVLLLGPTMTPHKIVAAAGAQSAGSTAHATSPRGAHGHAVSALRTPPAGTHGGQPGASSASSPAVASGPPDTSTRSRGGLVPSLAPHRPLPREGASGSVVAATVALLSPSQPIVQQGAAAARPQTAAGAGAGPGVGGSRSWALNRGGTGAYASPARRTATAASAPTTSYPPTTTPPVLPVPPHVLRDTASSKARRAHWQAGPVMPVAAATASGLAKSPPMAASSGAPSSSP
jgi:hypothetical protein